MGEFRTSANEDLQSAAVRTASELAARLNLRLATLELARALAQAIDAVRANLEALETEGSRNVINSGDLRIEPGDHRVYRNGRQLEIPDQQLRFLFVLASSAGRDVPVEDLVEAIWDVPPRSPVHNLQILANRLGKRIGAEAITSVGSKRTEAFRFRAADTVEEEQEIGALARSGKVLTAAAAAHQTALRVTRRDPTEAIPVIARGTIMVVGVIRRVAGTSSVLDQSLRTAESALRIAPSDPHTAIEDLAGALASSLPLLPSARPSTDAHPPSEIVSGDLRIEIDRRRVFRDGRQVALTDVEIRIVMALATKAGHLVRKADLIDIVWEENPPLFAPGALQVNISRLRPKIGPEAIQTAGRVGYRLRAVERIKSIPQEEAGSSSRRRHSADTTSPRLERRQ